MWLYLGSNLRNYWIRNIRLLIYRTIFFSISQFSRNLWKFRLNQQLSKSVLFPIQIHTLIIRNFLFSNSFYRFKTKKYKVEERKKLSRHRLMTQKFLTTWEIQGESRFTWLYKEEKSFFGFFPFPFL